MNLRHSGCYAMVLLLTLSCGSNGGGPEGSGNGGRSILTSLGVGGLIVEPAGAGLCSTGAEGGPFNPVVQTYTLTNDSESPIDWTASKTQDWVTLSKAGGNLAGEASDTLTVSINSAADALAVGEHGDTVTLTNTTDGLGNTTLPVRLKVNGSGPTPSAMLTANRTTGVAPLAVTFDAVPASGNVVQPVAGDYSSQHYVWHFGDDPFATWSTTGRSRNYAVGYEAAHVYDSPGNYTVTLTVTNAAGQTHVYEQQITVTAFSGATYYISSSQGSDINGGTTPGSPFRSLARAFSHLADQSGPVRILLKRGDEWTTTGRLSLTQGGPSILGAYANDQDGSDDPGQPKPRITNLSKNGTFHFAGTAGDWRIMDLELVGPGSLPASGTGVDTLIDLKKVLYYRLEISNFWVGIMASFANHEDLAIVDCVQRDNTLHSAFIGGKRLAILGNDCQRMMNSHVLRVWHATRSVISENVLYGSSRGHALKLHNDIKADVPDGEFIVVSGNDFKCGDYPWSVVVGPQNTESFEVLHDIVIEHNIFRANPGNQRHLLVFTSDTVVRNNLFRADLSTPWYTAISVGKHGVSPTPDRVGVYNNTAYRGDAAQEFTFCRVSEATEVTIRNNLASAPGTPGAILIDAEGPVTEDHNLLSNAPGFVDPARGDFSLQSGSVAEDAGVTSPFVRQDIAGFLRPRGANQDLGSFERVGP